MTRLNGASTKTSWSIKSINLEKLARLGSMPIFGARPQLEDERFTSIFVPVTREYRETTLAAEAEARAKVKSEDKRGYWGSLKTHRSIGRSPKSSFRSEKNKQSNQDCNTSESQKRSLRHSISAFFRSRPDAGLNQSDDDRGGELPTANAEVANGYKSVPPSRNERQKTTDLAPCGPNFYCSEQRVTRNPIAHQNGDLSLTKDDQAQVGGVTIASQHHEVNSSKDLSSPARNRPADDYWTVTFKDAQFHRSNKSNLTPSKKLHNGTVQIVVKPASASKAVPESNFSGNMSYDASEDPLITHAPAPRSENFRSMNGIKDRAPSPVCRRVRTPSPLHRVFSAIEPREPRSEDDSLVDSGLVFDSRWTIPRAKPKPSVVTSEVIIQDHGNVFSQKEQGPELEESWKANRCSESHGVEVSSSRSEIDLKETPKEAALVEIDTKTHSDDDELPPNGEKSDNDRLKPVHPPSVNQKRQIARESLNLMLNEQNSLRTVSEDSSSEMPRSLRQNYGKKCSIDSTRIETRFVDTTSGFEAIKHSPIRLIPWSTRGRYWRSQTASGTSSSGSATGSECNGMRRSWRRWPDRSSMVSDTSMDDEDAEFLVDEDFERRLSKYSTRARASSQ